jgi:hypothetical protein
VVLPQPLRPTSAVMRPAGKLTETSRRASTPPSYVRLSRVTMTAGGNKLRYLCF